MPPCASWSATTARPRTSSTPPASWSPTTAAAGASGCGPSAAPASRSSSTGPATRARRRAGWWRRLQGLRGAHQLADMAILVRTNAQTRALEDELLRQEVPYALVGGMRFYDRAEIKDVVAYLRVLRNPRDEISLRRILNQPPRGIGAHHPGAALRGGGPARPPGVGPARPGRAGPPLAARGARPGRLPRPDRGAAGGRRGAAAAGAARPPARSHRLRRPLRRPGRRTG